MAMIHHWILWLTWKSLVFPKLESLVGKMGNLAMELGDGGLYNGMEGRQFRMDTMQMGRAAGKGGIQMERAVGRNGMLMEREFGRDGVQIGGGIGRRDL